ncbi:hypothetical protein [Streptomyces sp. NPDC006463]|uniref:hypothetical protein n=1 Tax=Streptomyces sp. NPDC006463 TaxID=3364746 RepID=UPI0036BD9FF2
MVCPDPPATVAFGFGGTPVRTDGLVEAGHSVSAPSRALLPVATAMVGQHQGAYGAWCCG